MSVKKEHDYPRAPLTVTTHDGRKLDFEVDADGDTCIIAEVRDPSSFRSGATEEHFFWIGAEDWRAVVAHVAGDSPAVPSGSRAVEVTDAMVSKLVRAFREHGRPVGDGVARIALVAALSSDGEEG